MSLQETVRNLPAIKARQEIPHAKRKGQWVKTFVGTVVAASGLFLPKYLGYPWQVGLGVSCFGAFLVSQQLVLSYLKAIPQAIAAVVGALGGKDAG